MLPNSQPLVFLCRIIQKKANTFGVVSPYQERACASSLMYLLDKGHIRQIHPLAAWLRSGQVRELDELPFSARPSPFSGFLKHSARDGEGQRDGELKATIFHLLGFKNAIANWYARFRIRLQAQPPSPQAPPSPRNSISMAPSSPRYRSSPISMTPDSQPATPDSSPDRSP